MKKTLLPIVLFLLLSVLKTNAQNRLSPVIASPGAASISESPAAINTERIRGDVNATRSLPSQNIAPLATRIAGVPLSATPLTGYFKEDFEGAFPPPGWQVVDVLDPTYAWAKSSNFPYSGASSALIFYSNVGVSAEDWMILPQFTVASTDSLSFWMGLVDADYPPDTTFILISTTDSNLTSFTSTIDVLAEDLNYPPTDLAYVYYAYSLSAYAGQNIYIALKNTNVFGDGVYIDRLAVGTKPPDAAAISIDVPVFAGVGTISPKATFKNDGDSVVSFPVTMNITGGYSSTKNITNLAPGATNQVTFDPFNGSIPGNRIISIQTLLTGDTFFGNDTLTSSALFMETFTNYGWSSRAPIPVARYGAATVAINNNVASDLYVSGGFKSALISDSTSHFVPYNNTWAPTSSISKMPKGTFLASAATVDNTIYVMGGHNPVSTAINNNQIYDPIGNNWASGSTMISAVGDYALGVYNDSILYFMGGSTGGIYRNFVQVYVPSAFLWIQGTALPVSAAGWRGGIIGNKIVVTGGYNTSTGMLSSTYIGTINTTNPYLITWVAGPNYPSGNVTRLAGGASLDASSGLVLFTGGDPNGLGTAALNYTFAFDVNTNQWKVGPPKPTPANNLCNFTAVVDNDSLYMVAIGGNGPAGALTANDWLNLGPYQVVVGLPENNDLTIDFVCSPNPLNDVTNIQFALDKKAKVKAIIVDVLGNEMEVLADENRSAGNIVLTWNASSFADGIYFCRLTVEGKSFTQKLVKY